MTERMFRSGPVGFRKNRLEALQDGIFAVALTLLAVDLRIPSGLALPDVRSHLVALLPSLGVYVVTFAFISVVWLYVYSFQELVTRQDVIGSTLVLSATGGVALLPFTSSTFAKYPNAALAGHFFVLNIIAIVAMYVVYIEYARRKLIPRTVNQRFLRTVALTIWAGIIYVVLLDVVVVTLWPALILPAVIAGFVYGYVSVFVFHSAFVTEHNRLRAAEAAGAQDVEP